MVPYPGIRHTLAEFKIRHPECTACLIITCLNDNAEVITYFSNNRNIHLGSLLSDFAFVNGWTVFVKSVDIE